MAGYLIVLSAPLAAAIASAPALGSEVDRLRSARTLHTHKGFRHTQIFEDVWLGSFVHRFLAPGEPIGFVQLFRSETVVDLDQAQWFDEEGGGQECVQAANFTEATTDTWNNERSPPPSSTLPTSASKEWIK